MYVNYALINRKNANSDGLPQKLVLSAVTVQKEGAECPGEGGVLPPGVRLGA